MKKFYILTGKSILLFSFLFFGVQSRAQTTLVAGDIAFTGYISSTTDQFSFVLLKSITSGTAINFTDDGWLPAGVFAGGEETITWTANTALSAGTEIKITGLVATRAGSGIVTGTVTGTAGGINLTTTGDQILAYQGLAASPTFISGIHMNVYALDVGACAPTLAASWDPDCVGTGGSFCKLPPGLITGTNALWIGTETVGASEVDDARFNCNVGNIGTVAQARATLTNKANWLTNNFPTTPPFPLPSNCSFLNLSVLPVSLISFTGKVNTDKTATLQWKMEAEDGVDHYLLEKSSDALHFTDLGIAYPNVLNNGVYSINDPALSNGVNYYRVKIEKGNGQYTYTAIVALSLRSGLSVTVFPNPVKDDVTIQQMGGFRNTSVQLVDIRGHLVQQIQLTSPVYKLSMSKLSSGIYFLKTDDGSIFKLIKQ